VPSGHIFREIAGSEDAWQFPALKFCINGVCHKQLLDKLAEIGDKNLRRYSVLYINTDV